MKQKRKIAFILALFLFLNNCVFAFANELSSNLKVSYNSISSENISETSQNNVFEEASDVDTVSIDEQDAALDLDVSSTIKAQGITGSLTNQMFPMSSRLSLGYDGGSAIAEDGNLYSWGNNFSGEMGNGTRDEDGGHGLRIPQKTLSNIKFVKRINSVVSAINQSTLLQIWGAGNDNWYGKNSKPYYTSPVSFTNNVEYFDFNAFNNGFITEGGDLYYWGSDDNDTGNVNHELYLYKNNIQQFYITKDGWNAKAIIDNAGDLYMFGTNLDGQLGIGTFENYTNPTYFYNAQKVLSDVKGVTLWHYGCTALKNNGDVYVWGGNYKGILGVGNNDETFMINSPTKIMEDVKYITSSEWHCAAIKNNGDLYLWGNNECGEIGNNDTTNQYSPTKVLTNVEYVNLDSFRSMAITKNGDLYTWGFGQGYALGNGTTENILIPTKIMSNVKYAIYSPGGLEGAAVTYKDDVYVWGNSPFGIDYDADGNYTDAYQNLPPTKILSLKGSGVAYEPEEPYEPGDDTVFHNIFTSVKGKGEISSTSVARVADGKDKTITAIPADGYDFAYFIVDEENNDCGESVWGSNSYTFTNVKADHRITAIFRRKYNPEDLKYPRDEQNKNFMFSISNENYDRWDTEYPYECNLADFFKDSTIFNTDLVKMSMRVAMAAMDPNEYTGTPKRATYIKDLMTKLDFQYDEGKERKNGRLYDKDIQYVNPDGNTIGTAIGSRRIKNGDKEATLVLVAVRGGGYLNEWAGNFNITDADNWEQPDIHYGWDIASDTVVKRIQNHLQRYNITDLDNTKIWITGYSRAAAVTNITAAKLDDGAIKGIKRNNIFAFCFECPKGTKKQDYNDSRYDNITNIVNLADIIPLVAPNNHQFWQYNRYGITHYIPDSVGYKPSIYRQFRTSMLYKYKKILGDYCGENKSGKIRYDTEDLRKLANSAFEFASTQNSVNRNLVAALTYLIPLPHEYMTIYQGDLWNYGYSVFSENMDLYKVIRNIVDHARYTRKAVAPILATTVNANPRIEKKKELDYLAINHYPELQLAWIDTLSKEDYFPESSAGRMHIIANCPVNITVKNNEGAVIGKIIEDKPIEMDEGIGTYIDENGQKVVVIPTNSNYDINITSTDNSNVSLTREVFSENNIFPNDLESYLSISMNKGESINAQIISSNVVVKDPSGIILTPDINQKGESIAVYQVSSNVVGSGSIVGGGGFINGEFCQMSATPIGNAEFLGWEVDGEIKSTELLYRFSVLKDVLITAKFTKDTSEDSKYDDVRDGIEPGDLPEGKSLPEGIWIGGLKKTYYYTGNPLKPAFRVYYNNKRLNPKIDYTTTYKNNTAVEKNAKIVLNFKGDFTGSKTITFEIAKNPLSANTVFGDPLAVPYKAGKKNNKVKPMLINSDGIVLKYTNKDFDFKYLDSSGNESSCEEMGTYSIQMNSKSDSKGYVGGVTVNIPLIVTDKPVMSAVKVTGKTSFPYTGEKQMPSLNLKYSGETLNKDYYVINTISGDNYTDPGSHILVFKGDGINIYGVKRVTYKITGKKKLGDNKYTFVMIAPNSLDEDRKVPYAYGGAKPDVIVSYNGVLLRKGRDYTVGYKNNKKAGNVATVTVKGTGSYTGSIPLNFNVSKQKLSNLTLVISDRVESTKEKDYEKVPILFFDKSYTDQKLKKNTDYTAVFTVSSGSTKPAAGGSVSVNITAKSGGNYTGEVNATYRIIRKSEDISKAKVTIHKGKAYNYTGKPVTPSGNDVVVKIGNTPVGSENYDLFYSNNIKRGKNATILLKGKNNYSGKKIVRFTIGGSSLAKLTDLWNGVIQTLKIREKSNKSGYYHIQHHLYHAKQKTIVKPA